MVGLVRREMRAIAEADRDIDDGKIQDDEFVFEPELLSRACGNLVLLTSFRGEGLKLGSNCNILTAENFADFAFRVTDLMIDSDFWSG